MNPAVLEVCGLCKQYPAFKLQNVSFSLKGGTLTGFMGRNGAGKTTVLRSIMGFVHADSGSVNFFGGQDNAVNRQRTGFVSGGFRYYPKRPIGAVTAVAKRFYSCWDEAVYARYIQRFGLDERKTPAQLSDGMKVKFALALALSHGARLLLLDEPTSGLDPVSRSEVHEILLELCDKGVTILFSTHIVADLEKCAGDILYLKEGRVLAHAALHSFQAQYRLAEIAEKQLTKQVQPYLIGCKRSKHGYTALVKSEDAAKTGLPCAAASLDDIIVHLEKEKTLCSDC